MALLPTAGCQYFYAVADHPAYPGPESPHAETKLSSGSLAHVFGPGIFQRKLLTKVFTIPDFSNLQRGYSVYCYCYLFSLQEASCTPQVVRARCNLE